MKKELFALTPCQSIMLAQRTYSLYKQSANVATSVIINERLDNDILLKAVKMAVERNDAFKVRFCKDGKEVKQYFADKCEYRKLAIKDFSKSTPEKMEKFLDKESRRPVKIIDTPMIDIYILVTPEGNSGIFSCVTHMAMDSWAMTTFYKDVIDIYDALKNNTEMPKPLGSALENIKKELAYTTTEKHSKDAAFWTEELSRNGEPYYTHMSGAERLEEYRKSKNDPALRKCTRAGLNTKTRLDYYYVSQETADKMNDFCHKNRFATAQVLFIVGTMAHLAKICKTDDVGMSVTAARRSTLLEKRSGGTRVHFAPFRDIIDREGSFIDFCNQIYDQQIRCFKHMEINPFEIQGMEAQMNGAGPLEEYHTHALTFQPVKLEAPGGRKCVCRWHDCGASGNNSYLTVMDGDSHGGFKCYHEYRSWLISKEQIKEYQDGMMRVIENGIENPEMKMGELIEKFA